MTTRTICKGELFVGCVMVDRRVQIIPEPTGEVDYRVYKLTSKKQGVWYMIEVRDADGVPIWSEGKYDSLFAARKAAGISVNPPVILTKAKKDYPYYGGKRRGG